MNKENINKLIEYLKEIEPQSFNMEVFAEKTSGACGFKACVAGYAVMLKSPDLFHKCYYEREEYSFRTEALLFLGLTDNQAQQLFIPSNYVIATSTVQDAIAVLENLLETGEVDWNIHEEEA